MNMSETGLIDLLDRDGGPLCPGSYPPRNEAHALHVRVSDTVHKATPRDINGEPATPELAAVSHAVNYGPDLSERMRLYRDTVAALDWQGTVTVEALFFRCTLCGFVLPATRTPR